MGVTFTQLAYFLAVADVRSFTRAAESVGVAQPTLSRQLKALEPLARRMIADADSARTAVAEIVGLRSGRVRVGATPSLCIGVLADVLRVFHEQHPEIHLELAENGSQLLVRSLLRNELDLALVTVPA